MAESIGLIERAAALLRQREAAEPIPPPPPATRAPQTPAQPEPGQTDDGVGRELVLDRGRLASFGIPFPSSERSRTVEEFRLVKRNLMTAWSAAAIGEQRPNRLIMVTSARPGEGKTLSLIHI